MTRQARTSDTTAEAAKVYQACYESLSGAARIERSIEMAEEAKQITLAGIAHRHPEFSVDQIHREWLRMLHGDLLTRLIS